MGPQAQGVREPDSNDVFYRFDPLANVFLDATDQSHALDLTGNPHQIGDDAKAAMGMDIGDVDNDGDWDLYITDNPEDGAAPRGNVLYLGNGDGTLQDNTCDRAGICVGESTWPCRFEDFDSDGWVDLWVGTTTRQQRDHLFFNQHDGTFRDRAPAAFDDNATLGGSRADYDGDGDVDLAVWNEGADSVLLRNDTLHSNDWIEFKLFGTASNRDAIGAIVRVTTARSSLLRRVSGGDSAHSRGDLSLHFGVGKNRRVDVTIAWPSGSVQSLSGVATRQLVLADEERGILPLELSDARAGWSASSHVLEISVRTNHGGRMSLACPHGTLVYDAATTSWRGLFPGVEALRRVWLVSQRGDEFLIPVALRP